MSDSDEDSIGELVIDEGSETSEFSKFKSNHTIFLQNLELSPMQTRSSRVNPRFVKNEQQQKTIEELEKAAEDRLSNNLAGILLIFYSIT